jgi:aarF domain-containing kinase
MRAQAVSSRPDVAPPSFVRELEKLQDQIPPFPTPEALAVITADLGAPPAATFSYLSPEPMAAASLGQARAHSLPVHFSINSPSCIEA